MKNLLSILDLSVDELDELIGTANDMIDDPKKYARVCDGKILATLFFEPSTRTRLSFTSAMYALGGHVLGFSEASSSSVSKGESVADTARTVECYADIIAMRHPREGAPLVAACSVNIPVINAGDGGHNHPTQTLADLLTIFREKGRFSGLKIGFCGDLKYGRTVHSLVEAMSRYDNNEYIFISPKELQLTDYVKKDILKKNNITYWETDNLEDNISDLDILYMTRIQRERFDDPEEYERLKDSYVLNKPKILNARNDLCIMHPLPRVNEISVDVDDDPRACYYKQMLYGKYMRMALIVKLLNEAKGSKKSVLGETKSVRDLIINDYINGKPVQIINELICKNPKCITKAEQELPQIFRLCGEEGSEEYRCIYCDMK